MIDDPTRNEPALISEDKIDIDAEIIERLTGLNKVDQERAAVLRAELATLEGKIRQREVAIEALQGRKAAAQGSQGGKSRKGQVDPIKSARAKAAWETKRRNAELKKSGK